MSNLTSITPEVIPYSSTDIQQTIKIFREKKIPVYERGEDDYERHIATANTLYRFSTPPCVVQPRCACDVREVIRAARPRKIPITIKNGGHSYSGASTTNIGILMELSLMNEVALNVDSKSATVKGGALWFHVYKELVSKHLDGWVINGGRCPTVGVSGFMLAGGLSPFTRSFGMGCDTVTQFTIVTAEGTEVTVSERDDPNSKEGKLFWALRGAGNGNFGVVVEMKFSLQQLRSPFVVAGRYTWFPGRDDTDLFLPTMNSFYTWNWPREMTIDSTWICDLSNTRSDLAVRFTVSYNGPRQPFNQAIDSWTPEGATPQQGRLKEQLKQRSLQEPSSRYLHESLAAQWIEETRKAFPTNRAYRIYTSFVFENTREKIEPVTRIIREWMQIFKSRFAGESGQMDVVWIHAGGAANDRRREDMAFRWRRSTYFTYIMIEWNEKWLEQPMRKFLGEFKPNLSPYGMVRWATIMNFPDDTLRPDAHEQAYYGKNRGKLRETKEIWDPTNYFNWSQGIRLPAEARRRGATDQDNSSLRQEQVLIAEEALTDVLALQQWMSFSPPTPTGLYDSVVWGF
ncbi:hypothetical protein Asppvi_005800 [Aspergillus pseudoviridinutans]|uniref:FAD-binding PCMH-type domain-containing protein n=1 Tax=Aspergillus pseudoviridinutans TaxID=1517512 RepID=A0A9P3EUR5_9EURO|nr:uncharacterized protein Asppvi_005800 [Aspergillus pseudoviridinutans]GIJ86902.1 hypothetical protein Asppvi_005800 [Aspergillus pseudoviridinutans]